MAAFYFLVIGIPLFLQMRFFLLFTFFSVNYFKGPKEVKRILIAGNAQGTTYQITYFNTDTLVSKKQIDSILNKLDSSLSLYKTYSLVTQFNNSSDGMVVDVHLEKVVKKAMEVNHTTKGIFDITVFPFTEAWGFGTKKIKSVPSANSIHLLHACVGSNKLFWKGNRLGKSNHCVKLDPNGIAQGYSVDVLAGFLEDRGINNYLVELGGEIRIRGRKQPENSIMKIAIEVPGKEEWNISSSKNIIQVEAGAITTSGSYRKFYESKGKKFSHIIDARSGYPSQNELISVTVFAADAITADAYDNALMVMGLKRAIAFVEKRKDIAAHFIYRKEDGSIADTSSSRFRHFLKQ